MLRVGVVTAVLLLGASYLLFGAWWTTTDRGAGQARATGPVETRAPELAATATKPMTPDTDAEARVAARHLLDELRQMDETEQARHLAHRATSTPDARVPFSEELVAHLVALLRSKHAHLAQSAIQLLLRMGPRVAPHLQPFLASDATEAQKTQALWMIGGWQIQSPSVELPPLLPLLDDATPELRRAALAIVGRGVPYEPALAQRLLQLLREQPANGHLGPGTGLARMGPQGVALLVELTRAGETKEAVAALQALMYAQGTDLAPHLPLLAARIGDPAEHVSLRIAAIHALRAMRGDCVACLPALQQALAEDDYDLMNPVFTVLAQMGPRAAAAVPDLLRWLDESDPRQAERAATTLGAIRSQPQLVLPALEGLILRNSSDVVAVAIGAFGAQGYACAVRVLDEGDEYARYAILRTFANLGEQAASIVPRLIPLINGDDDDISARVIGTLGYLGPKAQAAVPAIIERLAQGEGMLSPRAAAGTLVRLGQPAEQALAVALRAGDETLRRQALRVLTHFHARTAFALPELDALARAKDARVRADAVEAAGLALFDGNDPMTVYPPAQDKAIVARVRAILERALADGDETVRQRAERFLAWIKARG